MRAMLLALVIVCLGAGCDGATPETTASAVPAETFVPDDPLVRKNVYGIGINPTGRTDIPEEQWIALAEAGCRDGAWDWGVSRALAAQFLQAFDPDGTISRDTMAQTVWLMSITACRDRFPQAAIERGPPPPGVPEEVP